MDGEFTSEHLEFVKHLNPQEVDHHYLVPQKNFDELYRILSLLSCGARRLSNEEYSFSNAQNLYTTSRFCKLCRPENLPTLYAGTKGVAKTFLGFPREIYQINTFVSLQPDKTKEIIKIYLDRLHNTLEIQSLEALADLEKEYFGSFFSAEKTPINDLLGSFLGLLVDLEKVAKKKDYSYNEEYKFKVCFDHKDENSLSLIKPRYVEMTINRFKEYNLELQEKDIEVIFNKEKIFNLD